MHSKNSKPLTQLEKKHLAAVKNTPCCICGAKPPTSAHHINQGEHFTAIALCYECHQGDNGYHGNRRRLDIYKFNIFKALNQTIKNIYKYENL